MERFGKIPSFSGKPLDFGRQYGEMYHQGIEEFFQLRIASNISDEEFIEGCFHVTMEQAPVATEIMKGIADATGLSLQKVFLLSLNEEIVHFPHCSAIATTKPKTVIGQNWDWTPKLSKYAGLCKVNMQSNPGIIAYQYPGLFMCAGMNETGLSLVWTGSGYHPMISPKVGVPSYCLIPEILTKKSAKEAVDYLARTQNAGSFIFVIADKGEIAICEAIPGKTIARFIKSMDVRTNQFEYEEFLPFQNITSQEYVLRNKCLKEWKRENITEKELRVLLKTPPIYRTDRTSNVTLDSFVANAADRTISISRGDLCGKDVVWETYAF